MTSENCWPAHQSSVKTLGTSYYKKHTRPQGQWQICPPTHTHHHRPWPLLINLRSLFFRRKRRDWQTGLTWKKKKKKLKQREYKWVCGCVFNKPVEGLKQVLCFNSKSLFILVSPLSGKAQTESCMYDTKPHEHIIRKESLELSMFPLVDNLLELKGIIPLPEKPHGMSHLWKLHLSLFNVLVFISRENLFNSNTAEIEKCHMLPRKVTPFTTVP